MVQINFAHKEIQCKIVYYGPGVSGKTTNLELVHAKTPSDSRGELTSIATTGERTLYFDYMPLDLGSIAGIRTKFQLYTVPGQLYYKSTRRPVLQGCDGIVLVADSSAAKLEENRESMRDLEENLREMGRGLADVPIVVQYNKRDLPDAMSVEDLQKQVNLHSFPHFEAVAKTGQGVFPTLKSLAAMVLEAVNKGGLGATRAARPTPSAPATAPSAGGDARPAPSASPAPAPAAPAPSTAGGGAPSRPVPSTVGFSPVARPAAPSPIPTGARPAAIAASAPTGPMAGLPKEKSVEAGVATATLPPPAPRAVSRPSPSPAGAHHPTLSSTPGPSLSSRPVNERLVRVSGLGRPYGGSRVLVVVGLLALIGAAAWFVVSRML